MEAQDGGARAVGHDGAVTSGEGSEGDRVDQVVLRDGDRTVPACVICGDDETRGRYEHHLTHGISVWLCATHGAPSYVAREGGIPFAERLAGTWAAAGAMTARRRAALRALIHRITRPRIDRELPGSYSWPRLRHEAERRFARGDDPNAVIAELRSSNQSGTAIVPSVRTMRRWFTDARWFTPPPQPRFRRYLPTRYAWLVPTRPDPTTRRWSEPPKTAPTPWDDT